MSQNTNEYDKEYYRKNHAKRKQQIRERNLIAIARNRANLREYLKDKTCLDCGFDDWRVLQFDHLDPQSKRANIGTMVTNPYSWESIMDEINKCEIICANCHIIRTGMAYGFHRFI